MSTHSTKQKDLDFLEACKTEDCHTVRKFILDGSDPILIRNECGQIALHVASLHGNMDIVELLVEVYGCNPGITDYAGRTALHLACLGGSIVVTHYLSVIIGNHHSDISDNTLLHYACLSGDVPTVRYVLHLLTGERYPYKLNMYWDVVAPYFDRNASHVIGLKNGNGETALHTACRAGHLPVLRCFIEELHLDQSLCRALASASQLACQYGRYDIFAYLVANGCCPTKLVSPTKSSDDTHTPPPSTRLFRSQHQHTLRIMPVPSLRGVSLRTCTLKPSLKFACQNGDEGMVRHLIEDYNCDPLVPDTDTGDTLLHFAAISGNVSLVSFLLDHQHDPRKHNKEGNTPLHVACKWGYLDIVDKLLHADLSVINAHNLLMESPLHVACSRNRSEVGKRLVGIDICDVMALNRLNETPLHVASCSSDYELIECILSRSKGALKCEDTYGDTPLFNACRVGEVNVVKLLVKTGCDPLHVNSLTCELPIHIACRTGNVALFQCLKNCMKSESWNQANIFKQTPLNLVCERGNLPLVNEILECASCDLNLKDERGMTPLHVACKNNNTEIAKAILAQPTVDVNVGNADGSTAFHLACVNDNIDTVTLVMQNEPDVTIKNEDGDTPVHVVCRHGKLQVFSKVLGTRRHGLKFEFNNEGVTPLHIASGGGHLEMVKDLINGKHCDPNAISQQGSCTPLHFACFEGHKDIAIYLAECAPETVSAYDGNGQRPVLLALEKKKYDVVKSLVPQYFDPNSVATKGNVPLFLYACEYGDADLLKCLVSDAECNPILVLPFEDTTVHFIVEFINPMEEIDSKFLYVLEICSSQINCVNRHGDTPLLHACKRHKNNAVTMLLEHDANPNCKDFSGDFPLHIACHSRKCDILRTLLYYKAHASCKDSKGNTALHIACGYSECDMVKVLLDYQADMSVRDSHGDTPLHIASRRGRANCVKILLDYKADISSKNSKEKTPIQVATLYEVTRMLLDHGANPQDVYTHYGEVLEKCKKEQPLHDMVKILIVGNALAGKTTLVETLKKEEVHITAIEDVMKRTAGIVSTPFRSDKLGPVIFHDFAGQQEFYGSHSSFLVNNLSSDAVVLLLVNALDEDSELVKNFSYWMSFIKHHCSNTESLPHIVIICSHVDEVNDVKDVKELKLKQAMQTHHCLGPVSLDCRNPASEVMCELKDLLGDICGKVRSNIELDCQCHVLFAFMHSQFKNKNTVELCQVQRAIRKIVSGYSHIHGDDQDHDLWPHFSYPDTIKRDSRDLGDLLPHSAPSLLNLLQTLHQKGHIILLKDENQQEKYWIVLKQHVFYETVHGTLFAPTNFGDNGPIRTNVGVVPLSALMQIFCDITTNVTIVTKYLVYKEFCHKVDDPETLQLISSGKNTTLENDTELYFFPCFIKVEKKIAVWEQKKERTYCSGWCLECRDSFFPTNFLHVLLLRLTFKYAVQHKDVPFTSHLTRRCDIWKNGIHWFTKEGVEVLVELTHNFTFLLVLIRSVNTKENVIMECVKLRASVIKTVFDVVKKTCPGLKPSENLIHRGLHDYPDCDLISAEKISIREAAESIKEGKEYCFSSKNEVHNLEEVLFFEPYCGIRKHLLPLLYANMDEEIPSNHVLELSECFSDRKEKLAHILNVSPVDIGDIQAHHACQQNPKLIPHHYIERWKISTRRGSYSDLRDVFDEYSIFGGRNPLALCN